MVMIVLNNSNHVCFVRVFIVVLDFYKLEALKELNVCFLELCSSPFLCRYYGSK